MKLVFFISLFVLLVCAQDVLVIDSNSEVKNYTRTIDAFSKNYMYDFNILDISTMTPKEIKNYLYDEYPDIVYAVGAKAYQYANEYIPEKTIYFSSIIDYTKLEMDGTRYGITNEVHNGVQLALIQSVFPNIDSLGVIYSKYTKNILEDLNQHAQKNGLTIHALKATEPFGNPNAIEEFIKKSAAVMIIPDPLFLSNETNVKFFFDLTKKYKKAVIAYHELFISYGAVLAISVDYPTIGRQIAIMIQNGDDDKRSPKIDYPIGTHVVFNKDEAVRLGVTFNPEVSQFATKIVE